MSDDENFLEPGFEYVYVSHEVWGEVFNQWGNKRYTHLQYVPDGQDVYATAGAAGTWLGKNNQKTITSLTIVAHGSPGSFTLGTKIKAHNVAPLGGWLSSFFAAGSNAIRILGCASAADDEYPISGLWRGQVFDTNSQKVEDRPGYFLLYYLAKASRQTVEGPLDRQTILNLGLKSTCRRVFPNGQQKIFEAGGVKIP